MSFHPHKLIDIDINTLTKAVESDFGFIVTETERINQGFDSQVYKGNLDDRVVFIKINDDLNIFPIEILGYQILKKENIPVPEIITYKEHPPVVGYPTMIMYSASGTELDKANLSVEREDTVYENMGKVLKKIHEIKIEGYGPIKIDGQKLRGVFSSWRENCESPFEKFYERFEYLKINNLLTKQEIEKLSEVYEEISSLDFGQSSLLHKDFHSPHIFIEQNQISGIIDLGSLFAGDPRYDIAISLFFQNKKQQESFKKGYGLVSQDPLVSKYLLFISATKIAFRMGENLNVAAESARLVFRETFKKLT